MEIKIKIESKTEFSPMGYNEYSFYINDKNQTIYHGTEKEYDTEGFLTYEAHWKHGAFHGKRNFFENNILIKTESWLHNSLIN